MRILLNFACLLIAIIEFVYCNDNLIRPLLKEFENISSSEILCVLACADLNIVTAV